MGIAERKERKKAELRELILVAAREIVLEHGFEALSMRKIAEAIEYSAATIYLHFENRDALAFELVREGFAEMLAAIAPVAAIAEPFERLREIARRYVAFGIGNPQTYRLIFMEDPNFSDGIISAQLDAPNEPSTMAFAVLQTTVDELIAKRIFRAADSETISQMLWATVHGIVALRLACQSSAHHFRDVPKLLDEMFATIEHGMLAPVES